MKLSLYRDNESEYVPGSGNPNAEVLLIGEAPGEQEDIIGKPFEGRSGTVLNRELLVADLNRFDMYVTNAVKARPPKNRTPSFEEIMYYREELLTEIRLIKPKVIVCLGGVALKGVLGKLTPSIAKMRRKILRWGKARLVPTYHPASTFYDPHYLTLLKEDLKKVRRLLK